MKQVHAFRAFLSSFCLTALMILTSSHLQAQCSGGTNAGAINPTLAPQTVACAQGGFYYTFTATACSTYVFSFCQNGGSASEDNQLTILDNTGAFAGGYSDDVCGAAAELSWTCNTSGTYRVLVSRYYCTTSATCYTMAYWRTAPAGAGGGCCNPAVVASLPFNATATTCGIGDFYSSASACGSSYLNGEDYTYSYTSPGNETLNVALTGTLGFTGVFVFSGCPSAGGSCVNPTAATNTNSSGNPSASFVLNSAGTYYIVVSTWPSPACTPFTINMTRTVAGPPPPSCYSTANIAYSPDNYNTGTSVVFPDDEFSGILPIGFTFCFMGTPYTDFIISSNGYISFNTANALGYSSYVTTTLPSAVRPETNNAIHLCWQDIDPSVSGNIRYRVQGTAPNRRLTVIFDQVAYFYTVCNSLTFSGQIKLYETTNIIELLIGSKPICVDWNSGNASQGIVAPGGASSVVIAGRNNTNWTATNEAIRLNPSCVVCTVPLDASITDFNGEAKAEFNLLKWRTSREEQVADFQLQRSIDGLAFETIATKPAQGIGGQGSSYSHEDHAPYLPFTHYRLVVTDLDGQSSHSEVVTVSSNGSSFSITHATANATGLEVGISAVEAAPSTKVELLDAFGRTIAATQTGVLPGANTVNFAVPSLQPGCYMIRVMNPKGNQVRKFIVN